MGSLWLTHTKSGQSRTRGSPVAQDLQQLINKLAPSSSPAAAARLKSLQQPQALLAHSQKAPGGRRRSSLACAAPRLASHRLCLESLGGRCLNACRATTRQVTATRAGAELPRTQAAVPPHPRPPAGSLTVAHTQQHTVPSRLTGVKRTRSNLHYLPANFKANCGLKLTSRGSSAKSRFSENVASAPSLCLAQQHISNGGAGLRQRRRATQVLPTMGQA